MNDNEFVDAMSIYTTVDTGGDIYNFDTGKQLKRIAFIVNGYPIILDSGYYIEKKHIILESYEQLKKIYE